MEIEDYIRKVVETIQTDYKSRDAAERAMGELLNLSDKYHHELTGKYIVKRADVIEALTGQKSLRKM